jgi:hypothetical protein
MEAREGTSMLTSLVFVESATLEDRSLKGDIGVLPDALDAMLLTAMECMLCPENRASALIASRGSSGSGKCGLLGFSTAYEAFFCISSLRAISAASRSLVLMTKKRTRCTAWLARTESFELTELEFARKRIASIEGSPIPLLQEAFFFHR